MGQAVSLLRCPFGHWPDANPHIKPSMQPAHVFIGPCSRALDGE